ncbi:MAG: hypothetical protein GXP55_23530 [Deltaproteobacteria bacterium]|nr:hypothetical protein [Deltaproteobacteria bacterium]
MSAAVEAPREQAESEFTPPLRSVLELEPRILAAVFVDSGGECVDYCSRVPSHEVKVLGAVMDILLRGLRPALARLGAGAPCLVHVATEMGSLFARPVDDEYLLALIASGDLDPDSLDTGLSLAASALRGAAGLRPGSWEPSARPTRVTLRPALGWPHAPDSFLTPSGLQRVEAVLGRWEELRPLADLELECFRVRLVDGEELTLWRDRRTGLWGRS